MGKYFFDITLVMGSGSWAGIYDVLTKTVLEIAICLAQFDPSLVCGIIDDAFWVDFFNSKQVVTTKADQVQ